MSSKIARHPWITVTVLLAVFCGPAHLPAQVNYDSLQFKPAENNTQSAARKSRESKDNTPANVLPAEEWRRLDSAVDRGLAFLASQQQPNGSFPSYDNAQPAVTSLCVLAFMAHGHTPGSGPYGERLDRAVKFIVGCQKPSGLIMLVGTEDQQINRDVEHMVGALGSYDHAISALTLAELYGMNPSKNAPQLRPVIEKSIRATVEIQYWPKDMPEDDGGWRYINDFDQSDSDLSLTGWHLMFLRSARNAGFAVPEKSISDAVAYIRRTFNQNFGTFTYTIKRGDTRSRGMTGAGILALAHAGFHNSREARQAAGTLSGTSFANYNDNTPFDRYHYSLFMCCQAMYQMGSPYWEQFFPRTARTVLAHQRPDGSWDAESFSRDRKYGNSYTTAMVILALGASNQLLPIFQR
jgi:hypothetical protein